MMTALAIPWRMSARVVLLCALFLAVAAPPLLASSYEDARDGLAAVRDGDYERGVELLTRAIESGDLEETNLTIAYYDRGNAWFYLEEYDKALEDLTTAIERNPRFLEAFVKRGAAYKELGKYDLAIADYTSALELNPNNGRALFMRGLAYSLAGDAESAMADIAAAHRIDQRYVITPLLQSIRAAGPEYAIKFMSRAIDSGELDPENLAWTYYYRGLAWREIGADQNAAADFSKAVELSPDMAMAYTRRADTAMEQGDARAAVADYTKALAINATLAEAYMRRGFAWSRLGNTAQAVRDFAAAKELDESLEIPDIDAVVGDAPVGAPADSSADASGNVSANASGGKPDSETSPGQNASQP